MKNHCFSSETWPQRLKLLAVVLCVVVGCGRSVNPRPELTERFRVSGPSMNPTLWGVSLSMNCPNCEIPIRVDTSLWEAARSRPPLKCWHCGSKLDQADADVVRLPPDEIQLAGTGVESFQQGQLVLLRHLAENTVDAERLDELHVKRILATPAQTVSVDDEGKLLVDNRIPRFASVPKLLVNSGQHRAKSRWHSIGDHWWRYHHVLVHRGNRPGPILDDYPGNLGVDRRLYRADRLSVVLATANEASLSDSPLIEEIQFWNDRPDEFLGLSNERPIAVRLRDHPKREENTAVPVRQLAVYQEIVYRVGGPGEHAAINRYPIELAKDEYFVVGDNVPLSVDSRSWGPVRKHDLLGRVLLGRVLPGSVVENAK